ncbi:MAG TPA: Maf family protein [Planctomycetota bacterium]|nr:Maf family protein [Planctomycetota bacterium]
MGKLVLASSSARRRELLAAAGWVFEVCPGDADETPPEGMAAEDVAVVLAERKARAVARGLSRDCSGSVAGAGGGEALLVIGADTIVALGEGVAGTRLLAKPADAAEARAMLAALSGSRHRVVTGVCVLEHPAGCCHGAWERTWVTMREISTEEQEAYVASGEWRGKAGGYAIQESADAFVTGLEEGGFDNVVGLPVGLVGELVRAAGGRVPGAESGPPGPGCQPSPLPGGLQDR